MFLHFVPQYYAVACLHLRISIRSTSQAIALKEHMPIDMVINLDVPRGVIVDRLSDRWIHPASGRVYAYSYRPPKVCPMFF